MLYVSILRVYVNNIITIFSAKNHLLTHLKTIFRACLAYFFKNKLEKILPVRFIVVSLHHKIKTHADT